MHKNNRKWGNYGRQRYITAQWAYQENFERCSPGELDSWDGELWYEAEKEKGLISVSVTCVEGLHDPELLDDAELASAIEVRTAEFMRMVNAPSLPDPEVLGEYSPRLWSESSTPPRKRWSFLIPPFLKDPVGHFGKWGVILRSGGFWIQKNPPCIRMQCSLLEKGE